jgi:hypothetical protein
MRRTLAAALIALSASPVAFAVSTTTSEPKGSIVRPGEDLEWRQSPDTEYPFSGEQKRYQQWMTQQYNAWRNLWAEPLNPVVFNAENRRVRRILTSSHRRAVRTGNWDVYPTLMEGTDRASNVRPVERITKRPSRRLIVREAQRLNTVQLDGR